MAKHPLSEGVIGEIFAKFFAPLIKHHKPEDMTVNQFLGELFGAADRDITRYVSTRSFRMPGLYAVAPLHKVQGIGHRDVRPDNVFYVRTDRSRPNEVEVEWLKPGRSAVFSLNSTEWGFVKLHLARKESNHE